MLNLACRLFRRRGRHYVTTEPPDLCGYYSKVGYKQCYSGSWIALIPATSFARQIPLPNDRKATIDIKLYTLKTTVRKVSLFTLYICCRTPACITTRIFPRNPRFNGERHSKMDNPSWLLYGAGQAKLEDRPLPKIKDEHDVIVKIAYVGVCGSDVSYLIAMIYYCAHIDCCSSCIRHRTNSR